MRGDLAGAEIEEFDVKPKWRQVVAVVLSVAITACTRQAVKPNAPPPAIVEVPVPTYVPVDDGLLERCQWRKTAPLEQMPSVARERKACLETYETNLDAIKTIRGRPVPKIGAPKPAIQRKK